MLTKSFLSVVSALILYNFYCDITRKKSENCVLTYQTSFYPLLFYLSERHNGNTIIEYIVGSWPVCSLWSLQLAVLPDVSVWAFLHTQIRSSGEESSIEKHRYQQNMIPETRCLDQRICLQTKTGWILLYSDKHNSDSDQLGDSYIGASLDLHPSLGANSFFSGAM